MVVRKIYRLIDPIRRVVPQVHAPAAMRPVPSPGVKRNQPNPTPGRFTLIYLQSGRAMANPLNMHNKK
jgi:hypothetical protein